MTRGKAKKKKVSAKKQKKRGGILRLFRDERFRLLLAFFFIAFAFLLLISQLSYLFTWKTDHSIEKNIDWATTEIVVENWAGKTGAYLANLTIYRWFGIASFALPFLLIVYGLRFLNIKLLHFGKTLLITLFTMIVLSVWLSYFSESNAVLGAGPGGKHGHYLNLYLTSLLGRIGVFLLLLLASIGIALYAFDNLLQYLKDFLRKYIPVLKGVIRETEQKRRRC